MCFVKPFKRLFEGSGHLAFSLIYYPVKCRKQSFQLAETTCRLGLATIFPEWLRPFSFTALFYA
jgi:hypothetical protein